MRIFGFEIKKAGVAETAVALDDVFSEFLKFKFKKARHGNNTPPENKAVKDIAFKMLFNIGANPRSNNGNTHIMGVIKNVRIDLWATTQKMELRIIGKSKQINSKNEIVNALKTLLKTGDF
jgi:hypothetical protein